MELNSVFFQILSFFPFIFGTISQSGLIARLGKFQTLKREFSEVGQFTINQFMYITKIHCTQFCFRSRKCLTLKFASRICTLSSYDPRIEIDTNINNDLLAKQSSLYGMSQTDSKMACFVDQSEMSNRAEIEDKCELGQKIIDSHCSDWDHWRAIYDEEICAGTKLFSVITRTRRCSQGLNGGTQCSGNIFEKKQKVPVLFHSDGVGRSYIDSRQFCIERGLLLFTNIALITADQSQFVSQENMTKLRDGYYYIDAMNTGGNKFQINTVGTAQEYFDYCLPLELVPG